VPKDRPDPSRLTGLFAAKAMSGSLAPIAIVAVRWRRRHVAQRSPKIFFSTASAKTGRRAAQARHA